MTYSINHINGHLLFKSATATDFKNAIEEALKHHTNLDGANLRNANLRNADLYDANLGNQWIIQGGIRSDGYPFFLQHLKDETEPMVKAGCRYFTVSDAFAHWKETRGDTPLGRETMAIIIAMIETMHIRGLK